MNFYQKPGSSNLIGWKLEVGVASLFSMKRVNSLNFSSILGSPLLPMPHAFSFFSSMRGKPRRGMLRRAVFSDMQRKGLEKMFQKQKYISKPDRKKLANKLGLKDSQVSNLTVISLGKFSRRQIDGLFFFFFFSYFSQKTGSDISCNLYM